MCLYVHAVNKSSFWFWFLCFSSICLSLWICDWVGRGRDAISLVHRPTICPLHHVPRHHLATVHPKRNQYPEIHEVQCAKQWFRTTEWRAWFNCSRSSRPVSVLGTLAATYLCVAVTVKYCLMEDHTVIITPEHREGSVTLFFSGCLCVLIITFSGLVVMWQQMLCREHDVD